MISLDRNNQVRHDGLSTSLQIAKASEYLACAELILQGWNAFLTDAGLPYDIVVDSGKCFYRIQVKATCKPMGSRIRSDGLIVQPIYRFAIRRSRTPNKQIKPICDFFAFVALDMKKVAWLPVSSIQCQNGYAKTTIDFKSREITYEKLGTRGTCPISSGKFLEDYSIFNP